MGRAVDIIKGSLTMRDIFAKYGFEQNRAGFIVCPFHSEKTASLGTYANDKRWKCFGCGAGGDVISFVMKLFELSFSQAVIRLGADFGFTDDEKTDTRAMAVQRRAQRAKELEELEAYRKEWDSHMLRYRACEEAEKDFRPPLGSETMYPSYIAAVRGCEYEWEWLQGHPWR